MQHEIVVAIQVLASHQLPHAHTGLRTSILNGEVASLACFHLLTNDTLDAQKFHVPRELLHFLLANNLNDKTRTSSKLTYSRTPRERRQTPVCDPSNTKMLPLVTRSTANTLSTNTSCSSLEADLTEQN
ncbi:hypothetical protein ACTXT7_013837 [Hymenolepis weldensis]